MSFIVKACIFRMDGYAPSRQGHNLEDENGPDGWGNCRDALGTVPGASTPMLFPGSGSTRKIKMALITGATAVARWEPSPVHSLAGATAPDALGTVPVALFVMH